MNIRAVFLITLSLAALPAFAQKAADSTPAATETTAAATAGTAATTTAPATDFDSRETQQQFRELLQRHPREVGVVLKLDPSLFNNEQFMKAYPALATFVAQHPEVPKNPEYFLESVWTGDSAPEPPAVRASREMLQGLAVITVVGILTSALLWLIRSLLDYRRWSRTSRVQTEVFNKLLDRFTSQEELLRYMERGGSRHLFELPVVGGSQPVAAPVNRIFWSLQAGVVLAAVGAGLLFVSGRTPAEVGSTVLTLGTIVLCAGLGFIVSSILGYVLSRKLGLLRHSAEQEGGLRDDVASLT